MPIELNFKKCIKCLENKDILHFSKRPDSKDGFRNSCRACDCKKTAEWTAKNPERAKTTQAACYKANPEKYKQKAKNYRKNNLLRCKLADQRKYYNTDKEVLRERSRRAYKKAPWNSKEAHQRYRNKKNVPLAKMYSKELKEIYKNKPKYLEIDHIIPISNEFVSGLHVPWNLQYLPLKENRKKGNKFDGTYSNESWRLECL